MTFADFIRYATPEQKAAVCAKVLDAQIARAKQAGAKAA